MADTKQQLTAARAKLYVDAYSSGDVTKIMTFISRDISFTEEALGVVNISYDGLQDFYTNTFSSFKSFKVSSHEATGTPEFTALELSVEGVAREDSPALNAKADDIVALFGVSLIWWRWEGEGEKDISAKGAEGWKIWKQKEFFLPRTAQ